MNCCDPGEIEDTNNEISIAMVPCLIPEIPMQYIALINTLRGLSLPVPCVDLTLTSYYLVELSCYYCGLWLKSRYYSNCLFYFQDPEPSCPAVILSEFDEEGNPSDSTLVIFGDKSYYFGCVAIKDNVSSMVAEGKGLYVSKQFLYKGQFEGGVPHGWGLLKTKEGQSLGSFVNGCPEGETLEKIGEGIFVGNVDSDQKRKGKRVTDKSKDKRVTDKTHNTVNDFEGTVS